MNDQSIKVNYNVVLTRVLTYVYVIIYYVLLALSGY